MTRPAKAPSHRQLRVGEEVRHALSAILMRGEVRDPELEGASITVSEVRMSPDLKNATAFVMPLAGLATAQVLTALKRAAPALRAQLARSVRLKFAPALSFELDRSFEHASRIDALLKEVRPDEDEPGDEPADEHEGGNGHGA